jgi:hypothetical protein
MHHSKPGWRAKTSTLKTPESIYKRLADTFIEAHEMTPAHDTAMGNALDDLRQMLIDEELL